MKYILYIIIVISFCISCNKNNTSSLSQIILEAPLKFSTNLDTGTYNVVDTLPLIVTVSSKLPSAGVIYSVQVTLADSAKQIFKLDSTSSQTSLSLKIQGLNKSGNYIVSVSVTSKSTATNSANKIIPIVNNPLARFMGYKVNSMWQQIGFTYWGNTVVPLDFLAYKFEIPPSGQDHIGNFAGITVDINNDGYLDIFCPSVSYDLNGNNTDFLIWNPQKLQFDDKHLINDSTLYLGNIGKSFGYDFNHDGYTDILVLANSDEGSNGGPPKNPIQILLSDGKGGFNLIKVPNFIPSYLLNFPQDSGDIGDLNGDGLPDIFTCLNTHTFIFWGIPNPPYFTNQGSAHFASDTADFPCDNGFGEVVPDGAGAAYNAVITDINKDGLNDILIGSQDKSTKPEFLPILKELKEKDPHDLIRPDTFFTSESDARGFVWTLVLRQVRKMDKVQLINE